MKYVTRTGGATVTVFVPYDCKNHCPFCINKAEYQNKDGFSIDEIIKSIKIMSIMTPECDFVFTGGEPLADCDALEKMLKAVHQKDTNHKVFINTTLPVGKRKDEDYLSTYLNYWYYRGWITGINVSRHLERYVEECYDKIFKQLDFEPRINCVLYRLHLEEPDIKQKLIKFVERFKGVTDYIQFRKDYVVTTPENLYDEENDEILRLLKDTFEYKGLQSKYRMRCGYEFDYNGYRISYHKTLPYSKIPLGNDTYVLYDIIIKQNGSIREDWDTCSIVAFRGRKTDINANELDLTAYKNVTYEDYK